VTGVLHLPTSDEQNLALVSVQRSSRLVLHDLDTGKARRLIDLADRGGNPMMKLHSANNELWATDYDTLVVLDTRDWHVQRQRRLQDAAAGTQQFIGDFAFAPDGRCVIARPFSGDVVAVSDDSLKVVKKAKLGHEPLEVAPLTSGRIVARDWKTGALLCGNLTRSWFAV
jgi:hypothetical protein